MLRSLSKQLAHYSLLEKSVIGISLVCAVCFSIASAWYVLHGSVYFFTDIGRDFLLMDDMLHKITLIGARTSMDGVYHGPLWLYLNFPLFVLSHGNAWVVSLGWLLFSTLSLTANAVITKKYFGGLAAVLSTTLLLAQYVALQKAFTNPAGALWLMPLLAFTVIEYWERHRWHVGLAQLLILGCLIQFEMLIGIPLLLLCSILMLWTMWRNRQAIHLILFVSLVVPLSTFVLFDVRHHFMQLQAILAYAQVKSGNSATPFTQILQQRWNVVTQEGVGIFPYLMPTLNVFNKMVAGAMVVGLWLSRKQWTEKHTRIALLLFLYAGTIIASLGFRGELQFHYWWPLYPLPIMAVAGSYNLVLMKWLRKVFLVLLVVAYIGSLITTFRLVQTYQQRIGNIEDDWVFLTKTFEPLFSEGEETFGFFIYAPDVYAYEQKYALHHVSTLHARSQALRYQKAPVTYLVIAPPSGFGTEMTSETWKQSKLKLLRPADQTWQVAAGYRIEKYLLSEREINEGVDPTVLDWIFFR